MLSSFILFPFELVKEFFTLDFSLDLYNFFGFMFKILIFRVDFNSFVAYPNNLRFICVDFSFNHVTSNLP